MIHELKFSSDTKFSDKNGKNSLFFRNGCLKWPICPKKHKKWLTNLSRRVESQNVNRYHSSFYLSKYEKRYGSSNNLHFTTQQLIFKLKSVKYDLNTVCPRKNSNYHQNLILVFFACSRRKRGEICSF